MATKFCNDDNRWKIADRYVCRAFWCQMTGLSEAKAKKIRTLAMHGHSACAGPRARPVATNTAKSDVAFAFWNLFFENNCQRPNAETRLFPVNKTYTQIYEDYFVPWLSKQNLAPAVTPSFTTWRRARYDDAFRDVKRRARHNHCRCETSPPRVYYDLTQGMLNLAPRTTFPRSLRPRSGLENALTDVVTPFFKI